MITGDYAETAVSIAKQIGLSNSGYDFVTGDNIVHMSNEALRKKVKEVNILPACFPRRN